MKTVPASWGERRPVRRTVPLLGALLIGAMVALALFDIVRGYRDSIEHIGQVLDTHARIAAEQAARGMQAVGRAEPWRDFARDMHVEPATTVSLVQRDGTLVASHPAAPDAVGLRLAGFDEFLAAHDADGPGPVRAVTSPIDGIERFGAARAVPGYPLLVVVTRDSRAALADWRARALGSAAGTLCLVGLAGALLALAMRHLRRLDSARLSLEQMQERFALAVAGSDDGLWDWNYATGEAFASQRARAILGLSPGPELQSVGAWFEQIERQLHPDDVAARLAAIEAHLQGATPAYEGEFRVRAADGSYRWIRARGMCVRDSDGRPLRMAGSVSDVDARKRAEDALRVSEERYALAMTGSTGGHWVWDARTDALFVSGTVNQLFGLPPGTEPKTRAEYFRRVRLHPDDREMIARFSDEVLSGRSPRVDFEYRILVPGSAEPRWILNRAQTFCDADGKVARVAGVSVDISERKRTEQSLRESEERFALAVAGSDDGIWDWNYVTGQTFASARALEIVGLTDGPATQTLQAWSETMARIMHPDDLPLRNAALEAHLAGRTPAYEGEWRVKLPGGGYRWVRARGMCVRDAAGRPLRIAGSISDIDARKRAEAALRESQERYALAVAGSNDGVLDWDIVHDRMFASPRAMRIAGVPVEERTCTRAEWVARLQIHPEDVQRHGDDFRRHLEGESEVREGEYRVRHADGVYRWVRVRGTSVRDAEGRAVRWAGSVSDIDAHKRAEQALRQSEERYQLAVAGSNEGLWDWDMRSDLLFVSARAQSLLGMAPGEPLRPRDDWIAACGYHPDDAARVRQTFSDHLHGRTPHFSCEYRMRHASGEWHWYRQRGVAVRDGEGRPYRVAGSMEDVTGRHHAEAARERLEAQLRQAQKLEAIGTLAGGIAHDFNNILAAILGYGEMVQRESAEGSAQRRHIDAAMSAAMRAKSLVERILAFSRSGVGERVPVHVQSVVEEALNLIAASLPKGVRLERQLDAGDAAVRGDPTQIHQVVMNLCANAVQAVRGAGTITVRLERLVATEPQIATTHTLEPGPYLRLSVRDSGVGIAPKVLERIFDPFFTTREVGVGTGLGLSLVHGIVTELGGGIDVQCDPGNGTAFTVVLPWQGTAPAARAELPPPPAGNGETVLLVDDEEPLVRLGEEMLAQLGYEPVGFGSSAAALASFRATPERFQAVVSDEAMPEMTGSELAREIRRLRADVPIVLMSGYVTPALAARAREVGAFEVLAKPLVRDDIARSLAGALQR